MRVRTISLSQIGAKIRVHRGSLTSFVRKTWGERGFEKSRKTGNRIIRPEIVNKLAKMKCPVCFKTKCVCAGMTVKKQAVLARTLRRFHH
jgi:hypothetical protein